MRTFLGGFMTRILKAAPSWVKLIMHMKAEENAKLVKLGASGESHL
jgi:hypothetical protein